MRLIHLQERICFEQDKALIRSNPIPKEIIRNDDIYELALADVKVSNGVILIQNSYISDLRL